MLVAGSEKGTALSENSRASQMKSALHRTAVAVLAVMIGFLLVLAHAQVISSTISLDSEPVSKRNTLSTN